MALMPRVSSPLRMRSMVSKSPSVMSRRFDTRKSIPRSRHVLPISSVRTASVGTPASAMARLTCRSMTSSGTLVAKSSGFDLPSNSSSKYSFISMM